MSSALLTRSIGSLIGGELKPPSPTTVKQPRLRLWETPRRFHCPIIGTCLSVADLERSIRKAGVEWTERPRDIDLHHAAVHKASEPCRLSRILHKLLEKRYARFVKRSAECRSSAELEKLWRDAMQAGELPGTLWAIITHPATDEALQDRVHGDVHMLSHLNGASHRAELARLANLEKENDGLRASLEKTRTRGNAAIIERDSRIRQLEDAVGRLKAKVMDEVDDRFLSDRLHELQQAAAKAELRADRAEARLAERERKLDEYARDLTALRELLDETRGELALAEKRLAALLQPSSTTGAPVSADLAGRRVVYIGGRVSLTPHLREMVERMDGRFVHHDGGLEDNRAALDDVVQGADLVFCPIDCVSHDACRRAKHCCSRMGARFLPLRSAGISSFVAGLEQALSQEAPTLERNN